MYVVGNRVTAVYPNVRYGSGVVIKLVDKKGYKPLVVQFDNGFTGYMHYDQVRPS